MDNHFHTGNFVSGQKMSLTFSTNRLYYKHHKGDNMTTNIQQIIETALSSTNPQFIGQTLTALLGRLKHIPETDHDSIYKALEIIEEHFYNIDNQQ